MKEPVLEEMEGGGGEKNASVFSGFGQTDVFDPSAPPPFKIAEIRAAIPKHCWIKSSWRSLSYVLRDLLMIFVFAAAAIYFNAGIFWPFYWVAQGTMFWAIFVLGHDCGHGSFSDNSVLNSLVGHVLHSAILVPYHGWWACENFIRSLIFFKIMEIFSFEFCYHLINHTAFESYRRISHRTHHQNHGNVENDESWVPLTEKLYKSLDYSTKMLRFTVPFPLLAYPFYLWTRGPGKEGSHFNPNSKLFAPNDRNDVITSTVCWSIMVALLISLSFAIGPIQMLKLYCVPYLIFVMWLDFVTYLQHHGYEQKLPWYRGKEWSYLRGGLTTVDRDYGWINNIHHDVGTHLIHHLFPQIPHYHLVEATEAAKPVLGKYYREPKKSGPIPFHLIQNLARSIKEDHYVSDSGEIVYYQTDSELYKSSRDKSN